MDHAEHRRQPSNEEECDCDDPHLLHCDLRRVDDQRTALAGRDAAWASDPAVISRSKMFSSSLFLEQNAISQENVLPSEISAPEPDRQ